LQVIAYNQSIEHLAGRELVPATEENKTRLVKRIADLSAAGQTEHHYALLAALRLKPEVIFLLTDGGDPTMNLAQLRLIRELAADNTTIHCVRFGRGPEPETPHFMARLAKENRGSYVYYDVNSR
jgi:Ca-activated chloride channel family protein